MRPFHKRLLARGVALAVSSALPLAFCFAAGAEGQDASPSGDPRTIALGHFLLMPSETEPHIFLSMRDRVASELVQKYDCVVLSRSAGMTIKTERDLGRLSSAASGGKAPQEALPAADYAVFGSAFCGKGGTSDLALVCDKLDSKTQSLERETFSRTDNPESAAKIVASVAKTLGLKPKSPPQEIQGRVDERWAVLPFSRLDDRKSVTKLPPDAELSAAAIMALQDTGVLKGIVDRDEMSKLIAELKIESLNGSSEGEGAKIAKLLGADKIITGVVSPINAKGQDGKPIPKRRLDLLLIDAKTAVVQDAATASCSPEELPGKAGELAVSLAKRAHPKPALKPASKELLAKEAKNFKDVLERINAFDEDPALNFQAIAVFEAACLLSEGDQEELYSIAVKASWFAYGKKSLAAFQRRQLSSLLNSVCDSFSQSFKETRQVHGILARAAFCAKDYDVALEQLSLMERTQDPNLRWINTTRGEIFMDRKDYKAAAESFNQAENYFGLSEAYRQLGDESAELESLRKIDYGGGFLELPQPKRLIDLLKKREGAVPALRFIDLGFGWYLKSTPSIQLRRALLLVETGEPLHAQQILHYLKDAAEGEKDRYALSKDEQEKLQTALQELDSKLGTEKYKMKPLKELSKIGGSFKIYLQPLGGISLDDMNEAAKMVKDFSGVETKVLPALPLPTNYAYDKARGQYDAVRTLTAVRYAIDLPHDGLTLSIVMKDDLYDSNAKGLRYIYSYPDKSRSAAVVSTCYLRDKLPTKIAICACDYLDSILYTGNFILCQNPECVQGADGSTYGISKKKFLVCYECEDKLKRIDPPRANKTFVRPEPKPKDSEELKLLDAYKEEARKARTAPAPLPAQTKQAP